LNCGIDISWNTASGYCSSDISYDIYKSSDPAFIASANNRVASDITNTQWHDIMVNNDTEYYYLVRSTDESNQAQDTNVVKLSDTAQGILTNGSWTAGAEIGEIGFGPASRHVGWELNSTRQHTGARSYWSQSNNNTCNGLLSVPISLTAGENSQLSFWTAYDIENEWDGGVVEISNNGNQWNEVTLSPNYPGAFNNSTDACNYAQNTPSFTGTNLTWQQHSMDLSSYQGQTINIRFNYSTDGFENNEGWFLDDISVTNTQIPGQCIISDVIYASGFE